MKFEFNWQVVLEHKMFLNIEGPTDNGRTRDARPVSLVNHIY